MIKENELRVGNWLQFGVKKYFKIRDGEDIYHIAELQAHSPIALTTEILEKGGFKKEFDLVYTIDLKEKGLRLQFICSESICSIVYRCSEMKGNWYDMDIEIKYLHELQNLFFALIGEELVINLNSDQDDERSIARNDK